MVYLIKPDTGAGSEFFKKNCNEIFPYAYKELKSRKRGGKSPLVRKSAEIAKNFLKSSDKWEKI